MTTTSGNDAAELMAMRAVEIIGVPSTGLSETAWDDLCLLMGGAPLPGSGEGATLPQEARSPYSKG